jgi:hypothetical protein
MKEKITLCIVHFNDADFVLNTLYCLKRLTKNKYKVIIRDNNSNPRFYRKLKIGVENYENVYLYRAEGFKLRGSLGHGTALNELVKKIDTPYGVILDSDCTFLIKNWGEVLINKLNDRIKIIGTQASGDKPKDFPLMFAILFETKTLKRLNIDFRPKDLARRQDTGWELREKYLKAGFQGKNIGTKNTRDYKKGPFRNLLGVEEYYLNGFDHIFASHFGRGSTFGMAKYKKDTSFIYRIPIISRPLRKMMGKREIREWIKICKEIVDSQI